MTRGRMLRFLGGVAVGACVSWIVLQGGIALLEAAWPSYAAAAPTRAYTLPMLFARLVVFSTMIVATSAAAARAAREPRMAWVAGIAILVYSLPLHTPPGVVWDAYPLLYHLVYLASILPLAWLGGHWERSPDPEPA